ncbi:MAG: toll/interleukin-1 receptor domain-containing protein [Methyloligellaceae bacterium]
MNGTSPETEATILISHAKDNAALAGRLYDRLQNYRAALVTVGFEIEKRLPFHGFWKPALSREIKRADVVLLILSDKWVHSPICMAHFRLAQATGTKVIAVLATEMDFEPTTSDVLTVDFSRNEGEKLEDLVAKVEEILGPRFTVYDTTHQIPDFTPVKQAPSKLEVRSGYWQGQFSIALSLAIAASAIAFIAMNRHTAYDYELENTLLNLNDARIETANAIVDNQKIRTENNNLRQEVQRLIGKVRELNKVVTEKRVPVPAKVIDPKNGAEQLRSISQILLNSKNESLGLQLALEAAGLQDKASKVNEANPRLVASIYRTLTRLDTGTYLKGHQATVFAAAFDNQGKRIVTTSRDQTLRIWDADSKQNTQTFRIEDSYAHSAQFSPGGKVLAAALKDGSLGIWNLESETIAARPKEHGDEIYRVLFNADGTRLATASKDGTAIIWNSKTWKPAAVLKGHRGTVWAASFNPIKKEIATASADGTVNIWNARSGKLIRTIQAHDGDVYSVAYAPDGKRLLTASLDGRVKLWDPATGKPITILVEGSQKMLLATFSPNNKLIATVGFEARARLWNATTFAPIANLQGKDKNFLSAAFSPKSNLVATASVEGQVRLWPVYPTTESLIESAIDYVSRDCISQDLRERLSLPTEKPKWCQD